MRLSSHTEHHEHTGKGHKRLSTIYTVMSVCCGAELFLDNMNLSLPLKHLAPNTYFTHHKIYPFKTYYVQWFLKYTFKLFLDLLYVYECFACI